MTEHIKIERKDDILTLTFARPDKKNALTNAMYGVLADSLACRGDRSGGARHRAARRGRHVHVGQ